MSSQIARTRIWYDQSYSKEGFGGQRSYPNEELLRFLGRHFFSSVPKAKRSKIRILELGVGSCANLWMIAHEGFDAYGVDLSKEAIDLGRKMLHKWNADATLRVGSMTELPFEDGMFAVVFDVFSSYCLSETDFEACLCEVRRVLAPNGLFFTFTPSAASDAFKRHAPSKKLDAYTLDGIRRKTSPYYGNFYPFRFTTPKRLAARAVANGLEPIYRETVGRTYRGGDEYFEFVTLAARRQGA